jgi:hypothetical protein
MFSNWFHYLNNPKEKNLLDVYKPKEEEIIVCKQLKTRLFNVFPNYITLKNFIDDTDYYERCFYEILTPNKPRKLYFDLDIDLIANSKIRPKNILENLKENILAELGENTEILVFSSNTEKKESYHVIVNNYFVKDEKACKCFYAKICENIPLEYLEFIDGSVYKNVQQFRLLKCHKFGKDNNKIFNFSDSCNFSIPKRYISKKAKELYIFLISLLGNINGCKLLSQYDVKEEPKRITSLGTSSEGDLDIVLDIFYAKYSYNDFEYLNSIEKDGNLIVTFRRKNPTFCEICKRIHENENPFVIVRGIERNIYFYCRRMEKDAIFLASLGQYKLPEIKAEDIPIIEDIENKKNEDDDKNPLDELEKFNFPKKIKYKPKINTINNIKLSMY